MASVRSIDSALNITLNTNGRVVRNLIHGADTVMSHILHFYHLAAPDFVDINALGSPWDDGSVGKGSAFGATNSCKLVTLTAQSIISPTLLGGLCNGGITKELVESYVMALNVRKEAHTMGAIFSGRQPIQNACVPGGVSTLFNAQDITDCRTRLNRVRNFINAYYIPDVVFVATRDNVAGQNWAAYWTVGTNPGKLLSYGEYPLAGGEKPFNTLTDNSKMLIHRGLVNWSAGSPDAPTFETFNTSKIKEYVTSSYYDDATNALHPSVGVTTPLYGTALSAVISGTGTKYSWLKAPRYNGAAAEVGPLARILATYRSTATKANVTEGSTTGTNSVTTYVGGTLGTSGVYNANQLVDWAVGQLQAVIGASPALPNVRHLFSPLGRHAARALECKLVADAMYSWLGDLTLNEATNADANYVMAVSGKCGSGYSYVPIPKTGSGEGLAEAPRGALGHWITIANKKISSYQCVVPSTWNACPSGNGVPGPAESVLKPLGTGLNVGTNSEDMICNIARMLHPYDFCIACAVHVVTPEGKEITKFEMGLDGKVKKL